MAVIDAWFTDTYIGVMTQSITIDISDTTPGIFKAIMATDAMTPDYDQIGPLYGADPLDVGEASGPGYTAGGLDLTVAGFAALSAANKVGWVFDGSLLWEEATVEGSGILVYDPATDRAYITRAFPDGAEDSADGDFEITFHEDGLWRNVLRASA